MPLTRSRYNEGSEISEAQVVLHISTKDQKFLNSKQLEIEYKTNDQKFVTYFSRLDSSQSFTVPVKST